MEKKISYLNRTYADYKEALIEMSERYYPDVSNSFRDASIGAWYIDLVADIADNLSYHIDRVYQETNINSAQEKSSLYAIARNHGVKIPGPKGAMAEVRLTAVINSELDNIDENAPIIKRGTKFSSGSQQFELLDDVDFGSQFDVNGNSDRTIVPRLDTNAITTGYTVSKLAVVTAGETKIFSQTIKPSDVKPFMEVLIPVEGVMNVESIIVVDGEQTDIIPSYGAFYSNSCEGSNMTRFYEVDNLAQNKCWLEDTASNPLISSGSTNGKPYYHITKGVWKTVKHKFITDYTDKGYLKVIFGCGNGSEESNIQETLNNATNFNQWQMSRILNNNNLGILPKPNSTLYILYRMGGGASSNVGKGAINKISHLNAEFRNKDTVSEVMRSLKVENTTPSISGKDMPNEQEMRYYIKYHNAAQERCVTLKDYIDRILLLPPKYGTPFRVGVAEENNKIIIYILGIDGDGKLSTEVPTMLIDNIKNYLSEYKMLGDYIEIKPGNVVNLKFDISVFIDKNYNQQDVSKAVVDKVEEYMNINSHIMGEEIYIGDILKEIGKIDGIINVTSIKVNGGKDITQEVDDDGNIDLEASDWVLYNDGNTMMEIKNPETDITINYKLK